MYIYNYSEVTEIGARTLSHLCESNVSTDSHSFVCAWFQHRQVALLSTTENASAEASGQGLRGLKLKHVKEKASASACYVSAVLSRGNFLP